MGETPFSGILLLDKPAGMTSHDAVGKVRALYATRSVGHTGTLDPAATGLLVVLVGRAVKASEYLTAERKTYRALLRLGVVTDTQDATGKILRGSDSLPTEQEALAAIASFVGKSKQIPPMVSALKIGGQKLCDLARAGITVEREAREIVIEALEARPTEDPREYALTVTCSKGTYIRTLCHDIGARLGCGGIMKSLIRLQNGPFSLENAITPDVLAALSWEERLARLLPLEDCFGTYPVLLLPPFYERLAKNGCEIYQNKIGSDYPVGTRLRLYDAGGFYALAEVKDYPDGSAVKIVKRFVLD